MKFFQFWVVKKLRRLIELAERIDENLIYMSERMVDVATFDEALANLTQEVTEMSGEVDSAIVLIQGLADFIRENANDPQALLDLAAQLDAKELDLANAVAANPVPEPPVVP